MEQGADRETADAVHQAIAEVRAVPGHCGVAVFAAGGRVALSELLPDALPTTHAAWAPLPHVMPLLVQRGEQVPHLLVEVDRVGADITVWALEGGEEALEGTEDLEGIDSPIHKVHRGGWARPRIQRRTENTWDRNARSVATEVAAMADRFAVEAILIAGDTRAKTLLCEHLPTKWQPNVTDLETGGRAGGTSPVHLEHAKRDAVAEYAARHRAAAAELFDQEIGRHGLAVQGVGAVAKALGDGQVSTVLVASRPESGGKLWIGPEPKQLGLVAEDVRRVGVAVPQQDQADAAIVRALAASDGALIVLKQGDSAQPVDGVGALLRHG
ncbi:baeRF2 domain-containing protein [Streptomyces halstedii]|uniref:baeRF2 domain-containing protein n=1 Tax=Streptomyces halstedii TaxID=1944 RepID=UPI0036CFBC25